ncbi:Amelotin [Apodemus speciosus]|uniref:Amelotin n=1 Tax=Apodemus speciosus TaxID=105296 RepID=A0ABQ0ERY6_APOSI
MILLLCLLGSAQSLPKQPRPAVGVPATKPTPGQVTPLPQQQPNQTGGRHEVSSSIDWTGRPWVLLHVQHQLCKPLWVHIGFSFHKSNTINTAAHSGVRPATGFNPAAAPHGTQMLPFTLGPLNGQQQLQPQMLPIIVAQLGAQPLASQIFTGLLIHPLFPGAIPPASQAGAKPDVQKGVLPTRQAGASSANQGTTPGHVTTPVVTDDDDYETSTPAGLRRATHTTEGTTIDPPNRTQ